MSTTVSSRMDDLMSKILSDESVLRVKDVENVRRKISKILEGGVEKLHVISDFDSTMTRHFREDMSRNPTCHQILSSGRMMSPEYKRANEKLYQKYFPIEMDTSLTIEEKIPYMVEWWSKAQELVIGQKLTKNDIKQMLVDTPSKLREGMAELLIQCKEKNIPLLIFSAGVSNIIEELLQTNNLLFPNMHIISNVMQFNPETGICDSFRKPEIHIFNKSEVTVRDLPYHDTIENRPNVILLGDSAGDLQMSQGISHEVCLTIGFLNLEIEKRVSAFIELYDIVVLYDGAADVVNWISEKL